MKIFRKLITIAVVFFTINLAARETYYEKIENSDQQEKKIHEKKLTKKKQLEKKADSSIDMDLSIDNDQEVNEPEDVFLENSLDSLPEPEFHEPSEILVFAQKYGIKFLYYIIKFKAWLCSHLECKKLDF